VTSAGGPRILAGRYRLDEIIGRGGMSTVYRGTDLALDRVVAVKVALDPLAEENPVYVARFKREAHAAAALNHPGIVTVYDAGTDGPTRFIVMEYVRGRSLAQILRDERPLEPARAARIAAAVADALSAAHAAGIVHRDIKPGNVMVADDGAVKVLDFGIARTEDAVTITQTALVLGTAPYMSPEQALGQPADARSDIYSLGCVLYEMLTGEPPFMAEVPAGVMHQHVRVAPRPPVALNPQVPSRLNALVLEMLAKSPDDRPQTAAQVRDRLIEAATGAEALAEAEAAPAAADVAEATPTVERAQAAPAAGDVAEGTPMAERAEAAPASEGAPAADSAGATPAADRPRVTEGASVPATAPTRPLERPPRSPRRAALWGAAVAVVALLVGAAVALALSGGSGSSGTKSTPPPIGTTGHASAPTTTPPHTTAPPTTTAPLRTTTTTPTTTTTVTTTTSPTTTTHTTAPGATSQTTAATSTSSGRVGTPTGSGGTPPGQGGTPPGQAKK
jgi:eukaryotic-like serine/threonine-protein kinase